MIWRDVSRSTPLCLPGPHHCWGAHYGQRVSTHLTCWNALWVVHSAAAGWCASVTICNLFSVPVQQGIIRTPERILPRASMAHTNLHRGGPWKWSYLSCDPGSGIKCAPQRPSMPDRTNMMSLNCCATISTSWAPVKKRMGTIALILSNTHCTLKGG